MGNQSSNEEQISPREETSSKAESETWDDIIVQIKVKGLSRSNSMEGIPEIQEEHPGGEASLQENTESKGESGSWDDVISQLKMETAKSLSRSSSIVDIETINEEEVATYDNRHSEVGQASDLPVSLEDKMIGKDIEETIDILEVSNMPYVEGIGSQKHGFCEKGSEEGTLEGPSVFENPKVTLPLEPGKESHHVVAALNEDLPPKPLPQTTTHAESIISGGKWHSCCSCCSISTGEDSGENIDKSEAVNYYLKHPAPSTNASSMEDRQSEEGSNVKMLSPLQSLFKEEARDESQFDELKDDPLKETKLMHRARSLKEKIASFRWDGNKRSTSFLLFTCGSRWPKD